MKLFLIVVLKECFYVGAFLYRLHMPNIFGGRAGFDMDASHVFLQGTLAAIHLVWDGAGERMTKTGARCEVGLTLWSVAVTALSCVGCDPKLLEKKS